MFSSCPRKSFSLEYSSTVKDDGKTIVELMKPPLRSLSVKSKVEKVDVDSFKASYYEQKEREKNAAAAVRKKLPSRRQFGTKRRTHDPFLFKRVFKYIENSTVPPQPKRILSGPSKIDVPEKGFEESASIRSDDEDLQMGNLSLDEDIDYDRPIDEPENVEDSKISFLCSTEDCLSTALFQKDCRHLSCEAHFQLFRCIPCISYENLQKSFLHPTEKAAVRRATIDNKETLLQELPQMRKALPMNEKGERGRRNSLLTTARTLANGSDSWDADDIVVDSEAHRLLIMTAESLERLHPQLAPRPTVNSIQMDTQLQMFAHSSLNMNQMKNIHQYLAKAESSPFWGSSTFAKRFQQEGAIFDYTSQSFGEGAESVEVVRLINLQCTLEKYLENTVDTLNLDPKFGEDMWLRMGIDRGGGTTKIALSIANRNGRVNSKYNWILACVYNGKDSAEDIRKFASEIFKEFNHIDFFTIKGVKFNVKRVLVGDVMSLSAVMGLSGPRSNFPCLICYIGKNNLIAVGAPRSASVAEEKLKLNNSSTRVNLSHILPPLVQGECFVTVPLLHSFLGPASDIFQKMENDVLHFAANSIKNGSFRNVSIAAMSANPGKELKLATATLASYEKWKNGTRSNITAECTPWCILCTSSSTDQPYLQCDRSQCKKWDHSICVGYSGSRREAPKKYKCFSCTKEENGLLDRLQNRCKLLEQQELDLQSMRAANTHPAYIYWKKLCGETGVIAQKFHGGSLNGNQTHAFLRNHADFVDVLRGFGYAAAKQRADCYEQVLEPLNTLHKMTKSDWLSDEEVEAVQSASKQLQEAMEQQDILSITPKIHMLIHHLPEMAVLFRTLGFFSEQGLEALHSESDALMANYKSYGDSRFRIEPVMKFVNTKHTIVMSVASQDNE